MKVLLFAYECSPYRGSEWAVGWGRLLQGARVAEMHVITSEPNLSALERARAEGLLPQNAQVYAPRPDAYLKEHDPSRGTYAYNYAAYSHWQKLALALANDLHAREQFDVVHQATVNTFREPGFGWQLGVPFVWGPVGGSQNFPARFLSMLSWKEALKEIGRSCVNDMTLRFHPRVRSAARAAAVVFASNSTNQRDYQRAWKRDVQLLLETGLAHITETDRKRFSRRVEDHKAGGHPEPLRLLWSGELQTRKALPILLRALARARASASFELQVLGDGPMRGRWEAETKRLGLDGMVQFRGRLPFEEAVAAMHGSDLFCFTSLRDTSGNVVLEALAAGTPVICFDHQGAADMVTSRCGVKVPVISLSHATEAWASALVRLAQYPDELLAMSMESTAQAAGFSWSRNGEVINGIYAQLAANASARRGKPMHTVSA